mgnify:CR=1 FL=1
MLDYTHKSVQISVSKLNMEKSNIDMQHEMELQLHEQYAINNNVKAYRYYKKLENEFTLN